MFTHSNCGKMTFNFATFLCSHEVRGSPLSNYKNDVWPGAHSTSACNSQRKALGGVSMTTFSFEQHPANVRWLLKALNAPTWKIKGIFHQRVGAKLLFADRAPRHKNALTFVPGGTSWDCAPHVAWPEGYHLAAHTLCTCLTGLLSRAPTLLKALCRPPHRMFTLVWDKENSVLANQHCEMRVTLVLGPAPGGEGFLLQPGPSQGSLCF